MPRFSPPRSQSIEQSKTNDRLSNVIDSLAPPATYPLIVDPRVNAKAGAFLRLAPRAAGQQLTVPAATSGNFAQVITLFVKNSLGVLRVRAASGTVNGQTALTFGIGTTAIIVLVSDGESGWATTVALGSLPDIPAGTVIGNPIDGADPGPPVALTGTQLGRIVQFNTNTLLTLGAGTFPAVVLPDANVIRFTHGGNTAIIQGIVAPTRPGQLIFLTDTSGGGDETIFLDEDAAAAAADRIRTPGGVPYSIRSGDYAMMIYLNLDNTTDRWVILAQGDKLYSGNETSVAGAGPLTVTLDGATGSLSFSTASTDIQSISGGTDVGRLLLVRFAGAGPHVVRHNGAGGGTEADIICPGNQNQIFDTRGSFLLRAIGASGWIMLAACHGNDCRGLDAITASVAITGTTDVDIINVTMPASSNNIGTTYRLEAYGEYVKTAVDTTDPEFFVTIGATSIASVQLNQNANVGTFQIHVVATFTVRALGAAGAAAYAVGIAVTGTTDSATQALVSTAVATATLDTTTDQTLRLRADLNATVASNSLSMRIGTCERIFN